VHKPISNLSDQYKHTMFFTFVASKELRKINTKKIYKQITLHHLMDLYRNNQTNWNSLSKSHLKHYVIDDSRKYLLTPVLVIWPL